MRAQTEDLLALFTVRLLCVGCFFSHRPGLRVSVTPLGKKTSHWPLGHATANQKVQLEVTNPVRPQEHLVHQEWRNE